MKSIRLHERFVEDILSSDDAGFIKRVLNQVFSEFLGSANRKNDHRYRNIENAWIRYVSRGNTAYRIIYLTAGNEMTFYRCGEHSIEDALAAPNTNDQTVLAVEIDRGAVEEMTKPLSILANDKPPYIYAALLGRRLIPNKSVYLVSPYISPDTLARGTRLGQTLDSIVGDGAEVVIITAAEEVEKFRIAQNDLKARKIELVFLPKLHSKIYLFITDSTHSHATASVASLGIIGSSNLTNRGVAVTPADGNLETNYTVSPSSIPELEEVVLNFYCRGKDYRTTAKTFSKGTRLKR